MNKLKQALGGELSKLYKELGCPNQADIEGVECVRGQYWFQGIPYTDEEWLLIRIMVHYRKDTA